MTVSIINPSLTKVVPYSGTADFISILDYLGLTSNLVLCLDAGDSNSYPGSGTKWLDVSGNSHDFDIMGSTGPVFNGTAGDLSLNEYWLFDNNGYFQADEAPIAAIDSMHQAGGQFTMMAGVMAKSKGVLQVFAANCGGGLAPRPGVAWNHLYSGGQEKPQLQMSNDSSTQVGALADTGLTLDVPIAIGLNYDMTTGDGFHWFNGSIINVFNDTNTSPSTSSAGSPFLIGCKANAGGGGRDFLTTGVRMYFFALWDGLISTTQMANVMNTMAGAGRDLAI